MMFRFIRQLKRVKFLATPINTVYKKYFIVGNITAGCLTHLCGDYIEQVFFEKQQLDLRRSLAFALWGGMLGVTGHYWYYTMNSIVYFSTSGFRQALLYQTIFTPIEYVLFYAFVGSFEGESKEKVKDEIKEKILIIYVSDCMIYFPLMMFIVNFIPLHFRVLVDHSFSCIWCVFLSFIKHNNLNEKYAKFKTAVREQIFKC